MWEQRLLGLSINLGDGAHSVDVVHLSELLVVANDWKRLVKISLDSLLDGLWVVIGTATSFSPLHAPGFHDFLWHIIEQNLVNRADLLLEVDSLIDGSWETVDKIGASLRWSSNETVDQDLDS